MIEEARKEQRASYDRLADGLTYWLHGPKTECQQIEAEAASENVAEILLILRKYMTEQPPSPR